MEEGLLFKKTRLAPTPSGYLHLGNILSFAITAALARKTGAKILLRIDDFDMQRTNKLYVQDIFDTLNFLELPWDEGPRNLREYESEYSIEHRLDMHRRALQQLRDGGHLFACTCSRTAVLRDNANQGYPGTCRNSGILLDAPNVSWRLDTADVRELQVKTLQGIEKTVLPVSMKDFIVRKKDSYPAYQLISVLDDLHYGVDLVVRGDDLWASTLAQQYLALLLGQRTFANVTFYHHPLVVDTAGNKLSKSEGATSVHYLRKEHKTPADIYALIATTVGLKGTVSNWQDLVAGLGFAV